MCKRSRRFTVRKNADNFARSVKGIVRDLSTNLEAKSKYKVVYTKENAKNRFTNNIIEIKESYYK